MVEKLKRKIVKALGGTLYIDLPVAEQTVMVHSIIDYQELRAAVLVDTMRPDLPKEVYIDALARELLKSIKQEMVVTIEDYPYQPSTKRYGASIWVGRVHE